MGECQILEWPKSVNTTKNSRVEASDLRELPIYSVSEVASYIGASETTLRSWICGRSYPTRYGPRFFEPLITAVDPVGSQLSFANLAEAHILSATRDVKISIPTIRDAIDYLARHFPSAHPLIEEEFFHDGKDLFIKRLEQDQTIGVSKHGQLGLRPILDGYLQRIKRDASGLPVCIFPMRYDRIRLDLNVSSGRPTLKGTGIQARMLWSLSRAGEPIEELACDYKLETEDIEEAVRYIESNAA